LFVLIQNNSVFIILNQISQRENGLEFLLQLKKMSVATPVIMLTGQGDETVAVLAMKEGARDYLVKGNMTPCFSQNSYFKLYSKEMIR